VQSYREELAGVPVEIHGEFGKVTHSYWMISILVESAADRDPLRKHLRERGIETRPMFYPVHTMPMYAARYQRHPVAENLAWRGINLPSWPGLTGGQVKEIAAAVREYFAAVRSGVGHST
jgi:perosamine synthetase